MTEFAPEPGSVCLTDGWRVARSEGASPFGGVKAAFSNTAGATVLLVLGKIAFQASKVLSWFPVLPLGSGSSFQICRANGAAAEHLQCTGVPAVVVLAGATIDQRCGFWL
jgi:hypothetical protein